MTKFLIILLIVISYQGIARDAQTFYFAKNGLCVEKGKDAYSKIVLNHLNKKGLELVYYTRSMGAWRLLSTTNEIIPKKNNQFLKKVENRGTLIDKTMVQVVDSIDDGLLMREYDGDFCIMEAEVKRLFPTIYNGKVTYFSNKAGKPNSVKYYYNNLEYMSVDQLKIDSIKLPENQTDRLPRYPGGINQFVKDVYDHTFLPQNTKLDELKGTFLFSLTIDSMGQQRDLHLVDTEEGFVAEALLKSCSSLSIPWKPATYLGKNANFTYLIPFQFAVNERAEESDMSKVLMIAEKMPEYPGGELQLRKDIAMNIRYPVYAQKSGIQGKVFVSFIIDADGGVRNVRVVRSVDPSLDAEAMRVVKKLPKWIPGEDHGKRVCVSYTVPINFVLTRNSPFKR